MDETNFYEQMKTDSTKRTLRIVALTLNAVIFGWLVGAVFHGLTHWVVFLVVSFWAWFLLNLFVPSIDYDRSRTRARRVSILFFLSLLLLVSPITRNGVFSYDGTMFLVFWYDYHFYGELLSKDMFKISAVFVALEFLWVALSTLFSLHIL